MMPGNLYIDLPNEEDDDDSDQSESSNGSSSAETSSSTESVSDDNNDDDNGANPFFGGLPTAAAAVVPHTPHNHVLTKQGVNVSTNESISGTGQKALLTKVNSMLTSYLLRRPGSIFPAPANKSIARVTTPLTPADWRNRDPLYSLLATRQAHLSPVMSSPRGHRESNLYQLNEKQHIVKQSNQYDIERALQFVRIGKHDIVRRAFDAAGCAIVMALERQRHFSSTVTSSPILSEGMQMYESPLNKHLKQIASCRDVSIETVLASLGGGALSSKKRQDPIGDENDNDDTASKKARTGGGPSDLPDMNLKRPETAKSSTPPMGTIGISKVHNPSNFPTPNVPTPSTTIVSLPSTSIDSRATVSRAILCAAASIAFKGLTPSFSHPKFRDTGQDIDVLDIPQNTHASMPTTDGAHKDATALLTANGQPIINMGAVMMTADIFGKRAMEQANGAARRGDARRRWRFDCMERDLMADNWKRTCVTTGDRSGVVEMSLPFLLSLKNPFMEDSKAMLVEEKEDDEESDVDEMTKRANLLTVSTEEWSKQCLPRLQAILRTGAGHAVFHDLQWESRSARVADLLQSLSRLQKDVPHSKHEKLIFGPHLIVTTTCDLPLFSKAFDIMDFRTTRSNAAATMTSVSDDSDDSGDVFSGRRSQRDLLPMLKQLRALRYTGSATRRRHLRRDFFKPEFLSGLPDTPYQVILTTYDVFIRDYVHLCQIPFHSAVMDDGMSWLGTSHFDPNGQLGKVWEMGVWSKSDNHAGLAGVGYEKWDFETDADDYVTAALDSSEGVDDKGTASLGRKRASPLIGISARHKVLLANKMHSRYKDTLYQAPVPGLLAFLIPQFADVVREEWDRSRIYNCAQSMEHIQKLLCRSIVVHTGVSCGIADRDGHQYDLFMLALASMQGTLPIKSNSTHPGFAYHTNGDGEGNRQEVRDISTDDLVSDGRLVQSRRFAFSWFCPGSPLRFELGSASLEPIMLAMKIRAASGHVCEEVVTASSITSSGAGGAVTGPSAYRNAVRCGRTFGSEQGLRQHMATLHAPPGTWLCRSCGGDCGTSQARTHHERYCGTNTRGAPGGGSQGTAGGGVPTVGQGIGSALTGKQSHGPSGIVGKKGGVGASASSVSGVEEKDKDGSFRVPGFRGVWVSPAGKHFVKVKGEQLTGQEHTEDVVGSSLYFDTAEEAAKKHDDVIKSKGEESQAELNYKADGTRVVYEDVAAAAAAGRGLEMLGGGASSVVPALSVINIKDLPKGVKPLLRDPRQTSRTGGNSKRYVYAYRGVCRQARKGHDRWQSQISFGGTNHYLGTFDSEWDAAAIYAWAHLVLYGEEATKKAQKEGEDAVAAYEQEKKDIIEGKIVAPPPKLPAKKKKPVTLKAKAPSDILDDVEADNGTAAKVNSKGENTAMSLKITGPKLGFTAPPRVAKHSGSKGLDCQGFPKVPALLPPLGSTIPESDEELLWATSERIVAARRARCHNQNAALVSTSSSDPFVCIPVDDSVTSLPAGYAILVGLAASDFGWDPDNFSLSIKFYSQEQSNAAKAALRREYGSNGYNVLFRTVMLGAPCLVGRAGKDMRNASAALCLQGPELGGSVGDVDCNVGGIDGSCSEIAAIVSLNPSDDSAFLFSACDGDDLVTLNGQQINSSMGTFPIRSMDVCSIGCRVFMFVTPSMFL